MFSGIIETLGLILSVEERSHSRRLKLHSTFEGVSEGESIAVDGTCLTVSQLDKGSFFVDLSPETLKCTIGATYHENKQVNLERSLMFPSRLGGHLVTGHVDETGEVTCIEKYGEFTRILIQPRSQNYRDYLVKKGSVAINGTSLTVNELNQDVFEVMLIPHTLKSTTFSLMKDGDLVNLEYDWMTRVIVEEVHKRLQGMNRNRET